MKPGASRSITVRRTVPGPPARVFEAWCRPELMARWFFPAPGWRAEVSADVQVGGRYRVTMFDPTGGAHVQEGVYQSIQPHHRLVFTWTCSWNGCLDSLARYFTT